MNEHYLKLCIGNIKFESTDIVRIESKSNYCKIIFLNSGYVVVPRVLKWFQENLDKKDFIRIHNSHLINVQHVVKIKTFRSSTYVLLDNGDKVNFSRRRKIELTKSTSKDILINLKKDSYDPKK